MQDKMFYFEGSQNLKQVGQRSGGVSIFEDIQTNWTWPWASSSSRQLD